MKKNVTLNILDIGYNSIRITGLKAMVMGIRSNKDCSVTEMGICYNFISNDGINYLFDELIFPGDGHGTQLKKLYIRNNFLSDFNTRDLG